MGLTVERDWAFQFDHYKAMGKSKVEAYDAATHYVFDYFLSTTMITRSICISCKLRLVVSFFGVSQEYGYEQNGNVTRSMTRMLAACEGKGS